MYCMINSSCINTLHIELYIVVYILFGVMPHEHLNIDLQQVALPLSRARFIHPKQPLLPAHLLPLMKI